MSNGQEGPASEDKVDCYKIARYLAAAIIVMGSVSVGKKAWELLGIKINSNGCWNWPEVAVYFLTVAGGLAFLAIVLHFVVSLIKIDEY